ncbi:MAG: GAF domain-containing sensor histidine kinase [Chloroflexota bacterium]
MKSAILRQLLTIGQRMVQTRDLDALLIYAVDVSLELLNGQYGYLVLLDNDQSLNFHVRRDRTGNHIDNPENQTSTTIIHKVIDTKQSMRTARAISDPDLEDAESVTALQLLSVLCVPLVVQDKALGVIYLENREESDLFRKEDIEPLEHLAAYAAVCIQNAMLNEEMQIMVRDSLYHPPAEDHDAAQEFEQERARILYSFIQDASHQFRTPLSIIKTSIDLLGRKIDREQYGNYLERVDFQVNIIVKLVDSLNLLAKLDSGVNWTVYPVDICFFVRDIGQSMQQRAIAQNKTLTYDVPEERVHIAGVAEYLRHAITGVIDNALQYTDEKGQIHLALTFDKSSATLRIEDNGIGISEDDIDDVTMRFFRGDKAGTTRGLGLGLSIVERVMVLHGGELRIQSELGVGTVVELIFPRDPMEAK